MRQRILSTLVDFSRFSRFATVGIIGATIDITISGTLVLVWSLSPVLAKFIGAEIAIILMFIINDRWTFPGSPTVGLLHGIRRLIKSNIVRSGGISIQLLVVFLLTRTGIVVTVAGTDIWPVLTMPIAIGCGFLVNYVGETLLTWRAYR